MLASISSMLYDCKMLCLKYMKLFPDDSYIQILTQAKEIVAQLFSTILDGIGENIAIGWIDFWNAVFANEWNAVLSIGFMLCSTILLGYRLIRNNLLDSIEHLLSRF